MPFQMELSGKVTSSGATTKKLQDCGDNDEDNEGGFGVDVSAHLEGQGHSTHNHCDTHSSPNLGVLFIIKVI